MIWSKYIFTNSEVSVMNISRFDVKYNVFFVYFLIIRCIILTAIKYNLEIPNYFRKTLT